MRFKCAVLLLALLGGCDHGEATNPEVITNDAQQIGQTSVVLEGNIKQPGSIRPIKYGFLWDSIPGTNILTAAHRLDLGSTDVAKIYSIRLDNLTANKTYFARAFAASTDYSKIYYANEISFKTLP